MTRVISLVSVVVALLLFVLVTVSGVVPSVGAQDATPPPGGFEIAPGVTAEILPTSEDPPSLYRLQFAPGVTYEIVASPSLEVAYLEAGTLTLSIDTPVTVGNLGATDAAGENIAADTEFTVSAGDYFALPPGAGGELRNDGAETAVVSVAGLVPDGMAMPAEGTPTS